MKEDIEHIKLGIHALFVVIFLCSLAIFISGSCGRSLLRERLEMIEQKIEHQCK